MRIDLISRVQAAISKNFREFLFQFRDIINKIAPGILEFCDLKANVCLNAQSKEKDLAKIMHKQDLDKEMWESCPAGQLKGDMIFFTDCAYEEINYRVWET